ncbi:MAG: PrsW family glutamic-type intramembrane protease [Chloroflexi bacterium]|nr:PrsW family glutamic-type intramembrane protease [Chloroflexota bacterium]
MSIEVLAYIIAIAIPIFYTYIIFSLDFFGTTKRRIVLVCLLWGALGAYTLAYGLNTLMFSILSAGLVVGLTAPILEEILKSLVLVYYVQRPEFRYIVDGAIYGFTAGIGFAAIENIQYINNDLAGGALTLAVSRVLSTNLMHATASAIVGLSLGALRRVRTPMRRAFDLAGIFGAMLIHIIFNNIVQELEGPVLLLVAIVLGVSGGVIIGVLINQELKEEKERFSEALGLHVGVSTGEREAVQNVGSAAMEEIFKEMEHSFGGDKVILIRRLLATQANIGILRNNLKAPAPQRLYDAWEKEIEELKQEVEMLRKKLGVYVTSYMNNIFPEPSDPLWHEELGRFDPTLVHTFDSFMRVSELAHSFTPEQLDALAERLHHIDIMNDIDLTDLANLSRAIVVREFNDGHVLFREGDIGDAMYLIEEGEIDISINQQDGAQKHLKYLGPGKVVGEFAVLDGEKRSATGTAHGNLKVLELNRQMFLMFIQSRPRVIFAMLKVLAYKARVTTRSVEDSIQYARLIADGKYEELRALAAQTRAAIDVRDIQKHMVQQNSDEEADPGLLLTGDAEPTDINATTPIKLCQTFATVATNLEVHEKGLMGGDN